MPIDCGIIQDEVNLLSDNLQIFYPRDIRGYYACVGRVDATGDIASAKDCFTKLQSTLSQYASEAQQLSDAKVRAEQNGCTSAAAVASRILDLYNRESRTFSNYISDASATIAKAEAAEKASAQAAATANNAGTGTPGTAGEGATGATGATGAATPANVTGTSGVTGATGAAVTGATGPKTVTPTAGASGATGASGITAASGPNAAPASSGSQSINGNTNDARSAAADSKAFQYAEQGDWRVRLSLAPAAKYLYKSATPGILAPLAATDGIIFPYTPSINVSYAAHYNSTDLTHSNYKIFQYQNSAIENITIGCDFTAQDTNEANYILAVIHFLRTATKMFYGQDENPSRGIPPPLCYLHGLGNFQFNGHPLVINNFTYVLPTDVDYIKAVVTETTGAPKSTGNLSSDRRGAGVGAGGAPPPPNLTSTAGSSVTYVPTKINIQFTAYPVVARNDVSNNFSVKEYASGKLLLGNKRPNGGGFW